MSAVNPTEPRVYTDAFLEKIAGLYNSGVRLKEIARILGYTSEQSLGTALSRCRKRGLIALRVPALSQPRDTRGMPPEQRKRVEDAAAAGMDLKEIAEIEGVTLATVSGHLWRQGFRRIERKPRLTVVPKPIPAPVVEAMQKPFNRAPDFSREVAAANDIFAKTHAFGAVLQALRVEAQTLEARLDKVRAAIETLQAIGETE